MARVLSIDYGAKRCGLAISDPLGMIANGLPTVPSAELLASLKGHYATYEFGTIVIGLPLRHSGEASFIETEIQETIKGIEKAFPQVAIRRFDERFTSKIAQHTLLAAGATKKQRREKGNIDKVSATLILQEYLNSTR